MDIPSVGSRTQEAMETAAQTRTEAAQEDVQAKMKMLLVAKMSGIRPSAVAAPAAAATTTTPASTASDSSASPSLPPPLTGAVLNVKK